MNFIDETADLLKKYDLTFNDITAVVNGKIVKTEDFIKTYNVLYDNSWGFCEFDNIQLIVDDYTWFERTSFDGCEKFILKAHPILSEYENQESHTDYFYR